MKTRKHLIEALRSTDEPELQGAIKNAIDIAEEDYMRTVGFRSKYISPKERKINLAISKKGKDKKYWSKMKSKNLSGMLTEL